MTKKKKKAYSSGCGCGCGNEIKINKMGEKKP
jgi:hypothetical protein